MYFFWNFLSGSWTEKITLEKSMITCSAWILSVTEYQAKKLWEAYLRWQEQKMHSKVASVDFRNKKDFGWHDHVETLCFRKWKVYE